MNYDESEAGEDEGLRIEEREDLRVRTKRFSLRVIRMFVALPVSQLTQVLGRQVLRSATSVGANYREAHRARSDQEMIAKLGDCLKELEETSYWFELLEESCVLPPGKLSALLQESNELTAIFTTITKSLKSKTLPKPR